MNRWMAAAFCGAVMMGCGASDPQIVATDVGTTSGADTGAPADAGTATDRGTATTDRGTATADTGTASEFGACGQSLHDALCMCGSDMTCQQTAQMNAIGRAGACQTCYGNAQVGCCPDQYQAVLTCAQDMGCSDQACAQRMCPTQVQAFLTCFTNGAQSVPACQRQVRMCFGEAFPMVACP
jgi:hypothetical protein